MLESVTGISIPAPGNLLQMACRCCGARQVEMVIDLGDQPHCNRLVPPDAPARVEPRYPLRLGYCRSCTMVQIDHTVPKESMFSDYPYVSGTTKTLPAHFAETSRLIAERYGLSPSDLVVDIGSNDGTWLRQYEPFGCRILGVEAAANVAKLANDAKLRTWNRFFNDACARDIVTQEGQAKVVSAAGVFFHLEDLHSVVQGIATLLSDDGVFVVQAIYLGGMIENVAFDQIYHEHLCYYTLRSLSALIEPYGLEVFWTRMVSVHGGSIEAHIGRKGRRPVDGSVGRLVQEEAAKGLGRIETYREFAARVLALREKLVGLLEVRRRSGLSTWAYGAPAKGATLLNSFGIGRDLVQRAVERNRLKVGLAIPGVRIPILEENSTETPDCYLVLAWNFIDEFLANPVNRSFLARGGEFIVPIPEVRSITRDDLGAA